MRPKGSKLSKEHKAKIALALKGNKNGGYFKDPIARGKKISQSRLNKMKLLGYINSPETRKKMSEAKKGKAPWNKGKEFSEESRKKMSIAQSKRFSIIENHPRWLGGKSFELYPREFSNKLKLKIRQRDNFTCQLCQVKEENYFQKLSINYIDYNKRNCNESNLITLCRGCNGKVNAKREYWSKYFKLKVQRLKTEYPT